MTKGEYGKGYYGNNLEKIGFCENKAEHKYKLIISTLSCKSYV